LLTQLCLLLMRGFQLNLMRTSNIIPPPHSLCHAFQGLLELDCSIVLPLPPGWSMGVSTSGRRFYICDRTRNTTWQHPVVAPRVPLGWERVEMCQGCVYYRQYVQSSDFLNYSLFGGKYAKKVNRHICAAFYQP
uniref:WW domain-containing protein n=1 Tax=Schistocephalus solidus TaxID=70667 RepID=A0A183SUX0_SCHSO